jgi:hypothetical protein
MKYTLLFIFYQIRLLKMLSNFSPRDVKELLAGCTDARICTFGHKAPFITRHMVKLPKSYRFLNRTTTDFSRLTVHWRYVLFAA